MNKEINHISLDFWQTLAKPNPLFAQIRNDLLANFFRVSKEEMKAKYTKTKKFLDHNAEQNNVQGDVIDAYYALFLEMGYNAQEFDAENLSYMIDRRFLQNPPIFNPKTLEALIRFKEVPGNTVSITSNTNFISGIFIEETWNRATNFQFNFTIFSDLVRHAKPSSEIFNMVMEKSGKKACEIAHIGDNKFADWEGAKNMGFYSMLIDGPDDVPDAIDMISLI